MRGFENFLDKPTDELTELLLRVARTEVAPQAARERALQSVASAALGVSLLSGTAAFGSRTGVLKSTGWLVAKWLAAGMGAGLLGITVAQNVQRSATVSAPPPASPRALSAPRKTPTARAAEAVPLAPAGPIATAAPELARPVSSAHPTLSAAAVAPAHEVSRTSQVPSNAGVEPSAPVNSKTSLTRELSLLERARSALTQHSASEASQALAEYRAEFPRGSMQVEAAALRVEAVAQSGNHTLARQLAQSFLTAFPNSPLAARVRAFSDVSEVDEQKP